MASYTYKKLEKINDNEFYTGTYRNVHIIFLKCGKEYYLNITNIILTLSPKVDDLEEIIEKWTKSKNTQYNKENISSRFKIPIDKYIFNYNDGHCYSGIYIHEKIVGTLIHSILLPPYSHIINDMTTHLMTIDWNIGQTVGGNEKNIDEFEISSRFLRIMDLYL